ncbi:hypothetical protein ABE073_04315 [Lederbergia citrisecunda]|uniref:hypothetical protein n=1 Tax=Lederbergia citrisecunda TaxID=2833583 RepID=UPI003D2D4694
MKKTEISGEVIEIAGTGMMGSYSMGDVQYLKSKDEYDSLTDLLYEQYLDKKVKITIEEIH